MFHLPFSRSHTRHLRYSVDVDEFHEHFGEPEPNATLEVLKNQGVQKGIIGIDNKHIRPTPLGIKRCKLDSSFYS